MFGELLSIASNAMVTISVSEIIILIIALSLCLLFRFNRMGLIFAFVYSMYAGWRFCKAELLPKSTEFQMYAYAFLVFGAVVLFLTIMSMVRAPDDHQN